MPDPAELEPEDYDVAYLWRVSVVAQEYGITPRQAAREIEDDPLGLALEVLPLRRYAEAFAVWKSCDSTLIKARRDDPMMRRVEENGAGVGE